ncbi:murein biosynthesis integral membrane protein MurJ [Hippea alviniae]|uniref:murein biosynthesis integral membrane protein MurJ n=1 Tax=Hippea alviniae TaxID=1279027 RepID=UPI0003B48414|nr:lipid II flippase MurJ [Hippea alviniae]
MDQNKTKKVGNHKSAKILASKQNIISGALWITLFTLGSKILGFVRQIITATLFGTTPAFDAIVIAKEPAVFFADTVQSSFSLVAVPFYLEEKLIKEELAKQFTKSFLGLTLIFLLVSNTLLFIFPDFFIIILAPGFSANLKSLSYEYIRIFTIFSVFSGVVNMFVSFLRAERMFLQSSLPFFAFNIFAIPILVILFSTEGAKSYPVAFSVASFFVLLISYFLGRNVWGLIPFSFNFGLKTFKAFVVSVPLFISDLIGVVNNMVDKAFASFLPFGNVSALSYSFNLISVVSALATQGIVYSSFTYISEKIVVFESKRLESQISEIIKFIIKVMLPVIALFIVASSDIVSIIYQHGRFTAESTNKTSMALMGYSFMLITIPFNKILSNLYISKKNTITITIMSLPFVLLNAFLDWFFVKLFGVFGLSLVSSIAGFLRGVVLFFDVKRRYRVNINFLNKEVLVSLILFVLYIFICNFVCSYYGFSKYEGLFMKLLMFFIFVIISAKKEIRFLLGKVSNKIKG